MSETDSFINEVTEEVRRDQLFQYLRRYGWIAVAVVLVAVGGTAWNEYRKAQAQSVAQSRGDAILAALEVEEPAARAEALLATDMPGASGAITGLLAAADYQADGDSAAAAAALDGVAANGEIPELYRDLALLKSVMIQSGTTAPEDRRALLSGISQPGMPFRMVALEQLALIEIETGNAEAAIEQFRAIAQDAEGTRGLRDRAMRMIVALGGDVSDLSVVQ